MENVTENVIDIDAEKQDMAEEKKEQQLANIDFKMVAFSLAGKDYAIDIMKVKEIAKAGRFTYVPNTSPFVLGVYNLRGEIIPIIDLRLFFNIPVPERTGTEIENMIIVRVGEQVFGVVIDAIDKVVGIQKSSIQPPHPLFGDISIKYISGVVESNGHLYILLDIDRIFSTKQTERTDKSLVSESKLSLVQSRVQVQPEKNKGKADTEKTAAAEKNAADFNFVVDSLKNLKKFTVSAVNEEWVNKRFAEWSEERASTSVQLADEKDADQFLKPFYSVSTAEFWSEKLADAFYKALPENSARQIFVWNPGCGKGYESYSLACVLRKRYPDAKIRIYAHDIDLLSVSNAPMLTIPPEISGSWYKQFLTKTVSGGYTFIQEVKDMVMFGYHDCMNTDSMQPLDIIFARDIISFLKEDSQAALIADFSEKLKGNGIVVIGNNEVLPDSNKWHAKKSDLLNVYTK